MKGLKVLSSFGVLALCILLMGADDSCTNKAVSTSGVNKATVSKVELGNDGLTIEQHNVAERIKEDNKPGAIKHLYVISPYSGQVILYSTVKGKVTSSDKRLSPGSVTDGSAFQVDFPGASNGVIATHEVLGDDGTYGPSGQYLYWWDVQGRYHQHYLTGGQIIHVSSEPLAIKSVIISTEAVK